MKFKFALVLLLLLTACGAPAPTPIVPSETSAPPSLVPNTEAFTPIPTFTLAPQATATPAFQLGNDGKTVVYDFTAHVCEANWMTGSTKNLPCPGDINNPSVGYVGLLSGSDQGLAKDFPLLLTFPAYNNGAGLFGRFPKFQVGPNDEFRASFTCRSSAQCEVEFTLAYYDANGKYQEVFPVNYYRMGVEPPINFVQPLNSLSGQTVEFVLVVRATYQSDPAAAWGLWIAPRILR
jgi:hypothetical protein